MRLQVFPSTVATHPFSFRSFGTPLTRSIALTQRFHHNTTIMAPTEAGSHRNQSPSASTFLSTLVPVAVVAAVVLSVFLIFRPKYKRVYEPRTYLPLLRK